METVDEIIQKHASNPRVMAILHVLAGAIAADQLSALTKHVCSFQPSTPGGSVSMHTNRAECIPEYSSDPGRVQ